VGTQQSTSSSLAVLQRRLAGVESAGVALLGLPWDAGSSFLRGAAQAPAQVRRALYSDAGNLFSECGRDLGDPAALIDLGDLALTAPEKIDAEAKAGSTGEIEAAVTAVLERGLLPLALGGDHLVTLPVVTAVARARGPLDMLVLDAHPDLYDRFEGSTASHASVSARVMERGLVRRLIQLGIRTLNTHQREQAEHFGVEIVEMRRWSVDALPRLEGPLYLSLDLDVLDPAHAPGVAHREPGGATTRQVLDVIQAIDVPVVGADVVELNPARDLPFAGRGTSDDGAPGDSASGDDASNEGALHRDSGITARVAAKLVKEVAALMLNGRGRP